MRTFSQTHLKLATFAALTMLTSLEGAQADENTPPPEGAPVPSAEQPVVTEPPLDELDSADTPAPSEGDVKTMSDANSYPDDAPDAPQDAPPPESVTVATEVQASESPSSSTFEIDVRPYDRERPNWALQVAYGPSALGTGGDLPGANASEVKNFRGVTLQTEWQPAFLQALGVIGLGPSAQVYPEIPKTTLSSNTIALWSVGFQARYQMKYFRGQWVVPMGGYSIESVQYNVGGESGRFLAQGPFAGAFILLNPLEPSAAGEFYATTGVKRTYLVAEARLRTGSATGSGPTVGETAWFFGLRSEW